MFFRFLDIFPKPKLWGSNPSCILLALWKHEGLKWNFTTLLLTVLHDWLQMSLLVPLNCFWVFHSYLHFHWSDLVWCDMGISFSQFCSYSWKEKQYLHGRISMFTCQVWTLRAVKIAADRIICQTVFHFILMTMRRHRFIFKKWSNNHKKSNNILEFASLLPSSVTSANQYEIKDSFT